MQESKWLRSCEVTRPYANITFICAFKIEEQKNVKAENKINEICKNYKERSNKVKSK